jgi:hypothetical protein
VLTSKTLNAELVKNHISEITLGDFTKEINKRTGYRYYFKTLDEDLVVKQELKDPAAILPCYHSRVVAWITPDVTTNGKGSSVSLSS